MRPVHLVLMLVVLTSLSGCLGSSDTSGEAPGTYTVESTLTSIEVETKSAYYQDGQAVDWTVESSGVADAVEAAGGNVVGVVLTMSYGEDESSGGPVCTGGEANAPDTITGSSTKGEWTLSVSDENPGSHNVNLTWHNASLLSGVIDGLTQTEIESQLAFGEAALGTYNLSVTVNAEAFNGALCSNNDDGEEVATTVSLLVLDFTVLNENGDETSSLTVGDGSIPLFLFAGWVFPVVGVIAFVSINHRERFQLDLTFSEPDTEVVEGESTSDGETLVDSYRARVITLSALYVAQGVPWGFITVTMVTFLAAEGADARHPTVVVQVPMGPRHRFLPGSRTGTPTTVDPHRPDRHDYAAHHHAHGAQLGRKHPPAGPAVLLLQRVHGAAGCIDRRLGR